MKLLYITLIVIGLTSCTENSRVRHWGGKGSLDIPTNKKLINATWKGDGNLWILYRDMRQEEIAESYTFKENSQYGIVEGSMTIKESKTK